MNPTYKECFNSRKIKKGERYMEGHFKVLTITGEGAILIVYLFYKQSPASVIFQYMSIMSSIIEVYTTTINNWAFAVLKTIMCRCIVPNYISDRPKVLPTSGAHP